MTEIILVMNGHMTKSYRKKLMYGQVNDRKHTKTFISRPFGNSLVLRLVGDCFLAYGARVGKQKKKKKKKKFAKRLKKKQQQSFSHQLFCWVGRETGNKTIF